jgi:hypothetical protein
VLAFFLVADAFLVVLAALQLASAGAAAALRRYSTMLGLVPGAMPSAVFAHSPLVDEYVNSWPVLD